MLADLLCPRCGNNSLLGKEKLIYCSSCDFVYYHNVAAAVAALVRYKEHVLMTVRKFDPGAGTLDLPGGFVDYNESAEEALCRELYEELGISVHSLQYAFSQPNLYVYRETEYRTLDMIFTAEIDSVEDVRAADDVAGWKLMKLQDIDPGEIGLLSIREAVGRFQHMM